MDRGEPVPPGRPAALVPGLRLVRIGGAELEVEVRGSGEPVVLIQTALIADELRPLMDQPGLRDAYTLVHYHRRGYGRSTPVRGAGSIQRDAQDCCTLLAALDVDRAHVVGTSYSGAVALQMAAEHPALVQTLTLVEPPPAHVPSAARFHAANRELGEFYRQHGPAAALDRFLTLLVGPSGDGTSSASSPARSPGSTGTRSRSSRPTCPPCCAGSSTPLRRAASAAPCCTWAAATAVRSSWRSASRYWPGCPSPRTSSSPVPTTTCRSLMRPRCRRS